MWNERDEEIAINNIYKRLIPLCCLLNQGTDIDPEIFWYSSFLLGDGCYNENNVKIMAFGN